jgi:hypothetical protein
MALIILNQFASFMKLDVNAMELEATQHFSVLFEYDSLLTNSVAPEPEGSSPHSQQPSNGPYPEPDESTPHPPNQSP